MALTDWIGFARIQRSTRPPAIGTLGRLLRGGLPPRAEMVPSRLRPSCALALGIALRVQRLDRILEVGERIVDLSKQCRRLRAERDHLPEAVRVVLALLGQAVQEARDEVPGLGV